jgi:hypothetical protein
MTSVHAAFFRGVFLFAILSASGRSADEALRIVVLRGEGANNNETTGSGTALAVQVLDAGWRPVTGALVVFSPPSIGPTVAFVGFPSEAVCLTNESGVAVAPRQRPDHANGPVEIGVMASHAGHIANAVIHEMNLGVGEPDDEGLYVVRVPLPEGADGGRPPEEGLRVRIEDGRGRPVAAAAVVFVLVTIQSRTDGEALAVLPKPSTKNRLRWIVLAELNAHRVSGFYSAD